MARKTSRPIRPNPLIATRTAIILLSPSSIKTDNQALYVNAEASTVNENCSVLERISIFDKLRAQATSSKFQIPSSKEASSSKLKNRPARRLPRHLFLGFGVCDLELLWSLEFGAWCFARRRLKKLRCAGVVSPKVTTPACFDNRGRAGKVKMPVHQMKYERPRSRR
jgi:hypothetical protein